MRARASLAHWLAGRHAATRWLWLAGCDDRGERCDDGGEQDGWLRWSGMVVMMVAVVLVVVCGDVVGGGGCLSGCVCCGWFRPTNSPAKKSKSALASRYPCCYACHGYLGNPKGVYVMAMKDFETDLGVVGYKAASLVFSAYRALLDESAGGAVHRRSVADVLKLWMPEVVLSDEFASQSWVVDAELSTENPS